MKQRLWVLALWTQSALAQQGPYCPAFKTVTASQIVPKIESGIPFELMMFVDDGKKVLCRQVIHVEYKLWEEKVILTQKEKIVAEFPFPESVEKLCKVFECPSVGKAVHVRLLFNPLWAGRLARLQVSSGKLVSVNWDQIEKELPAESLLYDKESLP